MKAFVPNTTTRSEWGARPPRAQRTAPSWFAGDARHSARGGLLERAQVRREGAPNRSRGGCAPPQPSGLRAISRGLSSAERDDPPGQRHQCGRILNGCQTHSIDRLRWHPFGVLTLSRIGSGGIASLNPRLMADTASPCSPAAPSFDFVPRHGHTTDSLPLSEN